MTITEDQRFDAIEERLAMQEAATRDLESGKHDRDVERMMADTVRHPVVVSSENDIDMYD